MFSYDFDMVSGCKSDNEPISEFNEIDSGMMIQHSFSDYIIIIPDSKFRIIITSYRYVKVSHK